MQNKILQDCVSSITNVKQIDGWFYTVKPSPKRCTILFSLILMN